jgi:hypothetical protein
MRGPLPLLLALAVLAGGCGGAKVKPPSAAAPAPPRLEINVTPPSPARLPTGTIVSLSVQAVPSTELAWVSGTVKLLGVKPRGLRSKDGRVWTLQSQVPPMVTVPPGIYELKVWGRTLTGEYLETSLPYEVR